MSEQALPPAAGGSSPPQVDISYRRIFTITGPVFVSQMSYAAMGIIDTIMVGQLGLTSLAAVGLGNFLVFWFLSLFFGVFGAVDALVAQAIGARRPHAAGVVLGQAMILALLSAVVLFLSIPALPYVLAWTDATPEVQAVAGSYMAVRLVGGIFFLALVAVDNFYRGLGQTLVPMWCCVAQLVLNACFNYLLIFGKAGFPALGTVGAAWGTAAAQLIVATALAMSLWLSPRRRVEFGLAGAWRFQADVFRQVLRIGAPFGLQVFMEMGGITVFMALIAQLGEVQLAASNAVIQAWSVGFMTAFALSVGATTLVGQTVGAGEPERGREAVRRVLRIGYLAMASVGLLYLTVPERIIALFVRDADFATLMPFARPLFYVVVVCLFLDLIFNVVAGALRGAGDTRYTMWVNIGSAWLLFVPATWIGVRSWGLLGAWSAFVLHLVLMVLVLRRRFGGRAWQRGVQVPIGAENAAGEPSVEDLPDAGNRAAVG